jgi:hypothetical protein
MSFAGNSSIIKVSQAAIEQEDLRNSDGKRGKESHCEDCLRMQFKTIQTPKDIDLDMLKGLFNKLTKKIKNFTRIMESDQKRQEKVVTDLITQRENDSTENLLDLKSHNSALKIFE